MQTKILAFLFLSLPILYISWKPLKSYRNHGFYRFFGWECLLWMIISNIPFWFVHPFSWNQVVSWILLLYSIFVVVAGFITMQRNGKSHSAREGDALFGFEKTTRLVENGIFSYIRHPMYGSLIFLTAGVYLKQLSLPMLTVALAAIIMFYLTSIREEAENVAWFGDIYRKYMKRTKKFVPYIW